MVCRSCRRKSIFPSRDVSGVPEQTRDGLRPAALRVAVALHSANHHSRDARNPLASMGGLAQSSRELRIARLLLPGRLRRRRLRPISSLLESPRLPLLTPWNSTLPDSQVHRNPEPSRSLNSLIFILLCGTMTPC